MKKLLLFVLLPILLLGLLGFSWMNKKPDIILTDPNGLWVDSRAFNSLSDAVAAIGSTETTLLVTRDEAVSADLTIPSTCTLKVNQGAVITVANTKTLTINGSLEAGRYQIFAGAGTVILGVGAVDAVYPEWWGIDGTSDNIQIQAALDSVTSTPIILNATTYVLADSGTLLIEGNQRLQGAGRGHTILDASSWTNAGDYVIDTYQNDTTHQDRIILKDFKIQGPDTTAINGIGLRRSHRSIVEGIRIDDIGGIGICIDGLTDGAQKEAHYNHISTCEITGTHTHGIQILGDDTSAANRNILISCRDNGASTYSYQLGSTVSGRCNTNTLIACASEAATNAFYVAYRRNVFVNCITENISGDIWTTAAIAGRNIVIGGFNEELGSNNDRSLIYMNLDDYKNQGIYSRIFAYENNSSSTTFRASSDISFTDADPDTISTAGAVNLSGLDDTIVVKGSTSNDGTYRVATSDSTTITLDASETLTTEAAGDDVRIESRADALRIRDGYPETWDFDIPIQIGPYGSLIFRTDNDDEDALKILTNGNLHIYDNKITSGSQTETDRSFNIRRILTTTDGNMHEVENFPLEDNTTCTFIAKITAVANDSSELATYGKAGLFYRNGGNCTLQGAVQDLFTDIESDAGMDATLAASGNDVDVDVTGLTGTTINWIAYIEYQCVSE